MHHNYQVTTDASGKVTGFNLAASGDRQADPDGIADNDYPILYDQYRKVFRPGNFVTSYVSVGRRAGRTNFNGSFQFTNDEGVLDLLKGFRRENFRLNVDHALADNFDLGMVSWSSDLWGDHLLFRDYLRLHPEIAREYETIKRELAAAYLHDKEQYTDAKGPFVRSIVRRALEEAGVSPAGES